MALKPIISGLYQSGSLKPILAGRYTRAGGVFRELVGGLYFSASGSAVPANTVAPALDDASPGVGDTITCSTGTWTNSPLSYAYQWLRDGAAITGETTNSYTVAIADAGAELSCRVTASNGSGASSPATSNSTDAIPWFSEVPNLQALYLGTDGFTESGGFVTQWDDQSGNANHIVITETLKPKWNGTDSLLMLWNLAASTINLPNTVSINSQAFTLLIVSDQHGSRNGGPSVGADGTMGYFSGVSDLSGMSCDATSQRAVRGFTAVLSGTLSVTSGHHQGWSIVGIAGSAARRRFFAADQIVLDGAPFAAGTQNGINIGGVSWNGKLCGSIKEIVLYSRDLDDTETDFVLGLLRSRNTLPTAKTINLAVDGDSLSWGTGEEDLTLDNYIRQFPATEYNIARVYNFAVPSQTVLQMVSGADDVDAVYDAGLTRNILFVFNADISHGAEQDQYCEDRVATGYEVFRGTPIAGNFGGGYDAARLVERARILGTSIPGVTNVDLAGATGPLSDYNDTTYYQSDKIHLTVAGNTILKNLFYAAAFP